MPKILVLYYSAYGHVEIMAEAAKIRRDTEAYHAALRDWVANGADSRFALSPDEVTWPDGAVGRIIALGADLKFGGAEFSKGTKFQVTRVETDPKKGEVTRVDLRESEGEKRELASVPVAILKQNGALGTAVGAPK